MQGNIVTAYANNGLVGARHRLVTKPGLAVLFTVTLALAGSKAAHAESMPSALTSAYLTNPGLDAQRASLRASDEEVPRAKAGFRPTVTGAADTAYQNTASRPSGLNDGELHPKGYALTVSQPLFRGFRLFNSLNVAEAGVRAARETLRLTEQQTLLDAATAYLDIVRDQGILQVRENNVRVLTEQLRSTREQFAVGEVTKTDVAQAEANRAAAVAALDLAKSNLRSSRATFERVVGHPAAYLQDQLPPEKLLPKTIEEAIGIGVNENPSIVNAVYIEQQARHQIDLIRGELLPTASLNSQYSHRYEPTRITDQQETTTVTGNLTWQFWNGGEVEARVRQAKQTAVQRLQLIEVNRSQIQANVVQAWSSLLANRAAIVSDAQALRANQTALTGVREEYKVGQRTLLDVLNAEQTLLNSQVTLITDQRNLVVASYTLLQAVGRLDAANLGLGNKIYDDASHYNEVKNKWTGFSIDYADGRLEEVRPGDGAASHYDIDGMDKGGSRPGILGRKSMAGDVTTPKTNLMLPPSVLDQSAPKAIPNPAPFKPSPGNATGAPASGQTPNTGAPPAGTLPKQPLPGTPATPGAPSTGKSGMAPGDAQKASAQAAGWLPLQGGATAGDAWAAKVQKDGSAR